MRALSHPIATLSIALGLVSGLPAAASAATPASPYWGRWTVADRGAAYSSRGREYKTIDIAPCGKDFCGVSVADNGKCGPVLFRFLMKRADGKDELRGHGRWGSARKNVLIWLFDDDQGRSNQRMKLYLGDGYDFGERSENMPKFEAEYRRSGVARCKAR
ncbi:MAG TPA: hypothetical protein PKN09_12810 [Novosphingobium sp.]|jgi:hypothetical protein|nr:hypothetical protein [Novosphingobium sp.]